MENDENDRPITEADIARGIEAFMSAVDKLERRVVALETQMRRQRSLILKLYEALKDQQAANEAAIKSLTTPSGAPPTTTVN
jgi:hypothetical protein